MAIAKANNQVKQSDNASNRTGKVIKQGDFFPIQLNMTIEGTLIAFRSIKDKFSAGSVKVIDVQLYGDHVDADGKQYEAGTIVTYNLKPGARAVESLELGAQFRLTPTGKVDTGKPSPAWTFELEVFEN